jgi:hypothetical protein
MLEFLLNAAAWNPSQATYMASPAPMYLLLGLSARKPLKLGESEHVSLDKQELTVDTTLLQCDFSMSLAILPFYERFVQMYAFKRLPEDTATVMKYVFESCGLADDRLEDASSDSNVLVVAEPLSEKKSAKESDPAPSLQSVPTSSSSSFTFTSAIVSIPAPPFTDKAASSSNHHQPAVASDDDDEFPEIFDNDGVAMGASTQMLSLEELEKMLQA